MFKKVSSLLLCGLISFSLFGLNGLSEDKNAQFQPFQPSKMEKIKAYVKIITSLGLGAGTLGFLGGTVLSREVSLHRIIGHPFELDLPFMARFTAISLAAMGLLYYGGFPLMHYSKNEHKIARKRNITISDTVKKNVLCGSVLCGFVAGLYAVLR